MTPERTKLIPSSGSLSRSEILEKLKDPTHVWANMLRGTIAKPNDEQIKHLYPHLFKVKRSVERGGGAMTNWKRTIPNQPIPEDDVDGIGNVWAFAPERPKRDGGPIHLCPSAFACIKHGVTRYQPTGLVTPEIPKEEQDGL